MTRPVPAPRAPPGFVGLLFFLSGLSALVYQVTWQRILALHSGVGIYSVAVIVAAFMAGLGLGSLLGGAWSPRFEPAAALRVFAALELGVAAFGALSCRLYYDLLYQHGLALYASPWSAGAGHFLALVVPTTLMGMSLPFLVRARVRDAATASRTIGVLYGVNVLGAATGALVAPWLLMRFVGLRGAVLVAAAGNVLVGLGALAAGRRAGDERSGDDAPAVPAATESHPPPAESHAFGLWLGLYALSGFCALSLEILWFRLVDVAVKSSAFTFGTVLCIYLLGSGLGALLGARHAPRLQRPLRAFLACQCVLLALSGGAVWLLVEVPARFLPRLHEYWARYDGVTLGKQGVFGGD